MDRVTVGIDIGGTKVLAGAVRADGTVLETVRRDTPRIDPALIEATVTACVAELGSRHDVAAVGVGAAGWFDREGSTIRFAPHLAWRDEPLRERLADLVGLPVHVDNDANATAWAEYRFGAARGHSACAVCITLGSGIGTGVLVDGRVFRGAFGIGPETGHMRLMPDGRRCGCGNRGCWERYCSGYALAATAREIAAASPLAGARLLGMAGGLLDGITGELVTQAAAEGDPAALECVEEVGRWLGVGLANVAAAFDPSVFVIGGGLSVAGELLLGPARGAYALSLAGRGHRPTAEIVIAQLGPVAGLVGAADLARYGRDAGHPVRAGR